jgi:hypothetical protein
MRIPASGRCASDWNRMPFKSRGGAICPSGAGRIKGYPTGLSDPVVGSAQFPIAGCTPVRIRVPPPVFQSDRGRADLPDRCGGWNLEPFRESVQRILTLRPVSCEIPSARALAPMHCLCGSPTGGRRRPMIDGCPLHRTRANSCRPPTRRLFSTAGNSCGVPPVPEATDRGKDTPDPVNDFEGLASRVY